MEYQSLSPNIGVKSVNDTIKFYVDVLGFNLIMSNPENGSLQWAMVACGDVTVMFQELQNLKEEYPQLEDRQSVAVLTFYIKMKNMHQLYEKIKETDYLAQEIHKTFYGTDEFAIFDNNGYILTITEDRAEPTTIKGYDNFFLPTVNYNESIQFYTEILGLKKKFEFEDQGMIAFKVGNLEPAIILKDKTKMPNSMSTIWFEVDNVNLIYEELKQKGVQFLSNPFNIRTGWAVEFLDPSGNRLGFTDYLN